LSKTEKYKINFARRRKVGSIAPIAVVMPFAGQIMQPGNGIWTESGTTLSTCFSFMLQIYKKPPENRTSL